MSPLYWLKLRLADLLVFQFWRRTLGGKVEGVVVGAAALQPRLGCLFSAAGVEIRDQIGAAPAAARTMASRFSSTSFRSRVSRLPLSGTI